MQSAADNFRYDMKRFTLMALGSALLLGSCNQAQVPTEVTVDPATSGVITFTLKPALPVQGLSGQALPTPSNVRVLVTNPATGFKVIKDVAVAATSTTVEARVPARDGYLVEAFSYLTKTQWDKRILKTGSVNNISVTTGQTSTVNVTLQPLQLTIGLPTEVVAGDKFKATLTNKSSFLDLITYFRISKNAFTRDDDFSISTAPYTSTSEVEMNAPASDAEGNLHVQTRSFIHERFAMNGESIVIFNYYSPSVDLGDAPASTVLKLPEGGIGIGIGY
ncbi:hypothetical protein [Deinococcus aquaticus]|uniref:hypothetical protein n=1 Tax=Deinococcus aquaticus TaxID=328692 RepID=UPI003F446215